MTEQCEDATVLRRMRECSERLKRIAALKRSGDMGYEESVAKGLETLDATGLGKTPGVSLKLERVRLAVGNGWIADGVRRIHEYWPKLDLPAELTGELDPPRPRKGGRPRKNRTEAGRTRGTVGMHLG